MITVLYCTPLTQVKKADFSADETIRLVSLDQFNLDSVIEDIQSSVLQGGAGRVLIVYPALEVALYNAVNQSIETGLALGLWRQFLQHSITLCKRHRGKVFLISEAALIAQSAALAGILDEPSIERLPNVCMSHKVPGVFALMARLYVDSDRYIKRLVQQASALECVSVEFVEPSLDAVTQRVAAEWCTLSAELTCLTEGNKDLTEESQLLLEQLHCVQEALESQLRDAEKASEALSDLKSELERTKGDFKQADAELVKTSHEKAELEKRLAFTLKEQREQHKGYEDKLAEVERRGEDRLIELKGAYEARLAEQALSLKDLTEENQLLLEQLHYVQEALEEQYIQSKLSEKAVSEQCEIGPSTQRRSLTQDQSELTQSLKSPQGKFKAWLKKRKLAKIIESSSLFDAAWYLRTYPDVAEHPRFRSRPALHYLQMGGFEGRNPSTRFDSDRYLEVNSDVYAQQMNPLLHYILHGKAEGRDPKP